MRWGVAQLAVHSVVTRTVGGSNPPAPAFMKYKVNDIVLVKSIAGPDVHVRLIKRIEKYQRWDAVLINEEDIKALRKAGVPYPKKDTKEVWVFDEEIIKKEDKKRKVR
jgi:hypothetical protein